MRQLVVAPPTRAPRYPYGCASDSMCQLSSCELGTACLANNKHTARRIGNSTVRTFVGNGGSFATRQAGLRFCLKRKL